MRQSLTITTPAAAEPVTLAELKLHMRIVDDAEHSLISALNTAARQYVEDYTQRAIAVQTYLLTLDGFPIESHPSWYPPVEPYPRPWDVAIELPRSPVSSVTSVVYDDPAGTATTLADDQYRLDLGGAVPLIVPAYGKRWPATRPQIGSVRITFVAGYTTVPEGLKCAIKLLVAHWYMYREPTGAVATTANVPLTIEALMSQYRITP